MSRIRWIINLSIAAVVLIGSVTLRAEQAPTAGTIIVLGGVGGLDPLQACAPWTLPRAGVPHQIEIFNWTHGKCRPLRDLQDVRYLLAQADRLVERVRDLQTSQPERPIYLLGHSAGAAIILAAAEKLPPASIERIVLLAPAVSPTYDLRPALRVSRRELVSFNSTFDRVCLDWCTSLFGTADRVYGPAAGLDGFREPDGLDSEGQRLYHEQLVQKPWRLEMLFQCTDGLHNGSCMPIYLAHHIAPWLMP
jgi:pimeloyl-ACP methyl ester carboxylesterase